MSAPQNNDLPGDENEQVDVGLGEEEDRPNQIALVDVNPVEIAEANEMELELEEFNEDLVEESDYDLSDFESDDESEENDVEENEEEREDFEVQLPTLHQYLGDTTSLRGRNYVDDEGYITIPLLVDTTLLNVMLIPGQTIPLTLFTPLHIAVFKRLIEQDRLFGVLHTKLNHLGTPSMVQYGTTAEIFEYTHNEAANSLTLKARGSQRFKLIKARKESTGMVVGEVKILPEIHLKDSLLSTNLGAIQKVASLSHPTSRPKEYVAPDMRAIRSARPNRTWRARRWVSVMTPWPEFVYNQYDDEQLAISLMNEINRAYNFKKEKFKIPLDPIDLSQWACVNLPLDDVHRVELLSLDTPTQRLRYMISVISNTNKNHHLCCTQCSQTLAKHPDIFCMSSEGPHGTFVNPGGYVHEMITLTKAHGLSVFGSPSTEHSWFPGYAWSIIVCKHCHHHAGWKFTATKLRLRPQKFFGITRKSVTSKEIKTTPADPSPVYVI